MRFPNFQGEWKEVSLGQLLEFKNGFNAKKDQYGKGIKFINVLDILENDFITNDKIIGKVSIEKDVLKKYRVEYGDILFQRSSETRKEVGTSNVYLDKENGATFGGFVIRGKKVGTYNPVFLNKLLKTSLVRKDITSKAGGSTRYNIGQEALSTVTIQIPSLAEQERIAGLLKVMDQKISSQIKIIRNRESSMKWIRHKLFSKQLRFKDKDGKSYPNWELMKLEEIGEIFNGLTGKTKDDFGKGKQFIQYKQIFDSYKINITKCDLVRINESENQNKVQFGDAFFTTSSETPDEIATSSILLNEVGEMYLNSFCFGFRFDHAILDPYFSQYLFRNKEFRRKIVPLAQGSTRYNISKKSFLDLSVSIPSLVEQKKISNLLSSLNEKVEYERQILQQIKKQKEYLLQNLFI